MGGLWRSFKEMVVGKEVTRTYEDFACAASRVINEDTLDPTRIRLVVKYVQTGYGSRNYVLDYGNYGAAQFFQYYLSGVYDFGDQLPTVSVGGAGVPVQPIKEYLEQRIEMSEITINGAENRMLMGEQWLWMRAEMCRRYFLDLNTSILHYEDGRDCYYNNEISGSYALLRPLDGSAAFYVWVWVPDLTLYYYTLYYTVRDTGEYRSWMYCPLNGVGKPINYDATYMYPMKTLNIDEKEGAARYLQGFAAYPVAMIRNSYWFLTWWQSNGAGKPWTITQQRYEDTVELLGNIGINLDDLTNQLANTGGIGNISDMYFLVAVATADFSSIVSRMLYQIFDGVTDILSVAKYTSWNRYSILYEEGAYNMYLEWTPRGAKLVDKVVGNVGTYSHEIRAANIGADFGYDPSLEYRYYKFGVDVTPWDKSRDLSYWYVQDQMADGQWRFLHLWYTFEQFILTGYYGPFLPYRYAAFYTQDSVFYPQPGGWDELYDLARLSIFGRHERFVYVGRGANIYGTNAQSASFSLYMYRQVSDTQCLEVVASQLLSQSFISLGTGKKCYQYLLNTDWSINYNLIIPLPIAAVEDLSFMERCELLGHAFYITYYAYSYQQITTVEGGLLNSGIFKWLGVVIGVIIAVLLPGVGTGLGASLIGATGAIGAAIANLFVNMLIGMALSVALKVIMKVAGNSFFGKILAAVAMIVSIYVTGGFDGAMNNLGSMLKTAVQLAEIPAKMVQMYVGEQIEDLQLEANQFMQAYEQFTTKYEQVSERYQALYDQLSASKDPLGLGVTTGFLAGQNITGQTRRQDDYMLGRSFSPSAFYYGAIQATYDYNALYSNDSETYVGRTLQLGILEGV